MSQLIHPPLKRARKSIGQSSNNESPPVFMPPEQEANPLADAQFAGFWMRLWAFLMDSLVLIAVNGIIIFPVLQLLGIQSLDLGIVGLATLLTAATFFLYFAIMTKYYGQTIGKMVFGLRVITKEGQLLSWPQVLFREGIGRYIQQAFMLLNLLYLTIAFTGNKQGIHDMIADSYVIHDRS